ncbi:MAG: hypothetical protein Fur0044_49430 [Anaerolineae bacterium]
MDEKHNKIYLQFSILYPLSSSPTPYSLLPTPFYTIAKRPRMW